MYGKLPKYSRFIFDTPLILNTAMYRYMPCTITITRSGGIWNYYISKGKNSAKFMNLVARSPYIGANSCQTLQKQQSSLVKTCLINRKGLILVALFIIYMMEHKENNTTKVEHISYLFIIYTCINNIINTFCI